jgi:GntR family transcriptional regulator, transcriptional repressor for pyruvate dehydrogenase complex
MAPVSVAEHLADYIAEHALEPGARLPPERELAAQLGISRPALREATRRLTGLSVLEPRAGSGTYLADIDHGDLMAVRLQLEPLAAALTATRASDEQHADLRALLEELRRLRKQPGPFAHADLALHSAIARYSGNRFVAGCLSELNAALRLSRARTAPDPARRAATLTELDRLLAAITARAPDAAADAMRAHLTGVTTTLER